MPTVKETFDAMAGRFRADKASGTQRDHPVRRQR